MTATLTPPPTSNRVHRFFHGATRHTISGLKFQVFGPTLGEVYRTRRSGARATVSVSQALRPRAPEVPTSCVLGSSATPKPTAPSSSPSRGPRDGGGEGAFVAAGGLRVTSATAVGPGAPTGGTDGLSGGEGAATSVAAGTGDGGTAFVAWAGAAAGGAAAAGPGPGGGRAGGVIETLL